MSFPSVKGGPSSGTCKEARTNLRPSGSWLVAEIVLVKSSWGVGISYWEDRGVLLVSCEKLWMLSEPQTWSFIYLGLLILGRVMLLFRKRPSDSQNLLVK